jgi:hypothetical protein
VLPKLSASVAISLMPTLKKTGVTVNEVDEDDRGSIECTASGTGRRTLRAEREPTTRGTGYCCDEDDDNGEDLQDG